MADIVEMIQLSPTMEEGVVVAWHKKVGDVVQAGDILAEVETDKATMEMESFFDGVLLAVLVEEGKPARIGAPIAVIGEAGEDPQAALRELDEGAADGDAAPAAAAPPAPSAGPAVAAPAPTPAPAAAEEPAPARAADPASSERLRSSPVARKVAALAGLDLRAVAGSAPGGRIVLRDVEAALAARVPEAPAQRAPTAPRPAAPVAEPAQAGQDQELALSPMRKTIAKRLTEAWAAPAFMLTRDVDVAALLELRQTLNASLERQPEGLKVSVNDFLIKAAAMALKEVPEMNAAYEGDRLRLYARADIGVAVALDGGLITPVVRGAETRSLLSVTREVRALVQRARDKKLQPEEYQGASFSISNLGMYDIDHFTAVLNPPAAGILAVGRARKVPVVAQDGSLVVGDRMQVTLTCDHRAVDGAVGARWLQAFVALVEQPLVLLAG